MDDLEIIILAGGKGTRMNDSRPKVLTDIKGKPMLTYLLSAVNKVCNKKPLIVVGYKAEEIKEVFGEDQRYVIQEQQLGTGHAVQTAIPFILPETKHIIVLYGDHPLIDSDTVLTLYKSHMTQDKSPVTMGTVLIPDFEDWRKPFYDFGRVIKNAENKIIKIVEKKDATTEELEIKEVNPSYFCFNADWLKENIQKLNKNNAQGEYYLTDLVGLAQSEGYELNSCAIPPHEALGVNTPEQLALVLQFIK